MAVINCKHLIILCILCIVLSACGKNDNEIGSDTGDIKGQTSISGSPVELSFFSAFGGAVFDENWPVFLELTKQTNIKLVGTLSKGTNEKAAYNLMLSSGELADIIAFSNVKDLEMLGRKGGVIPLNDLIKNHAPNISRFIEENDDFKAIATATDGNIYCIPMYQDWPVEKGYFIRMDWLNRLNLEVPRNNEELYEVLKAFRELDPNGNGIKDEIPLFSRASGNDISEILYIWNSSRRFRVVGDKVVYDPLEEDFIIAIQNARKWYKEGLIDPEVFTRGKKARDELLRDDIGGFTHDWFGSTASYNDILEQTIEGFELIPILPPRNQHGKSIEHTSRSKSSGGWSISSKCSDPVTAIKLFDYFFTEKGHELINFGIEGLTYNKINGSYVYTDAVTQGDKSVLEGLRDYGVQYRVGYYQDFDYERAWLNDIAIEGMESYIENDVISYEVKVLGDIKYNKDQENELRSIMISVDYYVNDKIQEWILGISDFDTEYDGFILEVNQLGIQRAIEIMEEARAN